jgi:hypothetical protein
METEMPRSRVLELVALAVFAVSAAGLAATRDGAAASLLYFAAATGAGGFVGLWKTSA